jgi:hypothetical protein
LISHSESNDALHVNLPHLWIVTYGKQGSRHGRCNNKKPQQYLYNETYGYKQGRVGHLTLKVLLSYIDDVEWE